MDLTLVDLSKHWEFFLAIATLMGGYVYGKGQKNAQEGHLTKSIRQLTKEVDKLKKDTGEVDEEVKKIIEALERTYATMKYCHDTFTDNKTFDGKVDSLKDHISLSIEGLANVINLYIKMDKK